MIRERTPACDVRIRHGSLVTTEKSFGCNSSFPVIHKVGNVDNFVDLQLLM